MALNRLSKLFNGVIWNLLATVISQGTMFIITILIVRLLTPENYGAYTIVHSTIIMFSGLAGMGLGVTATKFVSEFKDSNKDKLSQILGLCSVMATIMGVLFFLLLFFSSEFIAIEILQRAELSRLIKFSSLYVLFYTLNGFQVGAIVGFEAFSTSAKISVIVAFFSLISNLILISKWGVIGASVTLSLVAFVNWAFSFYYLRRICNEFFVKFQYSALKKQWYIIYEFSLPAMLSGIVGSLAIWGSNALLIRLEEGLIEAALFNVVNNFKIIILFLPGVIFKVTLPRLNNILRMSGENDYRKYFKWNLSVNLSIALLFSILLISISDILLGLYGTDFINGKLLMVILLFGACIEVCCVALYQEIFSKSRIWLQFFIGGVCWGGVLFVSAYLFIPFYGAMGLAYSYAIAWSVSLLGYIIAYRYIKK